MTTKTLYYAILFVGLIATCSANWNRHHRENRNLFPNPNFGHTEDIDFRLTFAASEVEISELETEFNIRLNTLIGKSLCEPGYKCVALLVDAGLREPRSNCDSLEDGACEYQCGILSNIKYHLNLAKDLNQREGRATGVFYDVVLVHDFSIGESILAMARNDGARTLLISDSLKELVCSGIERQEKLHHIEFKTPYSVGSKACREAITFSQEYSFKLPQVLLMQAVKPIAFSLMHYQAATFLDTDAYVYSVNSTDNIKWFLQQGDDVELFAGSGAKSPVNAARWIGKPSIEITREWLQALRSGFNNETGWEEYGPIPQVWGENYSPDTKGSWEFMGANRDQGLLWYIFGLKRKSLYQPPRTGAGLPFGLEYMIKHLSGIHNPWSSTYIAPLEHIQGIKEVMGKIARATSSWKIDSSTLSLSKGVSDVDKFLHSCAMRIEKNSKM
eukprot:CAMPEP_0184480210 /NCGR_PEP_ID=MMETSP0113_2-20130426/1700_1 /TAXON_ID=91329 /ORGANISM="Norrisiella sphaerica, Strain BC52" /LENGTH=443 /DNA_ID=CAMNT_0026858533 /DNA_START=37 /DNA_END=1368 /DNA_ORIENTATION=+